MPSFRVADDVWMTFPGLSIVRSPLELENVIGLATEP